MRVSKTRGFSLAETLVAIGLLSVLGYSAIGYFGMNSQNARQLKIVRLAIAGREKIAGALKNPISWKVTLANNSSFDCADRQPGCNLSAEADTFYPLVLYGPESEKVTYDPADPTTRIGNQNIKCEAGTPNPSPNCPLKYVAKWRPVCDVYPCLRPMVELKVELVTEFGDLPAVFNPAIFKYSGVRAVYENSLQSICIAMNGVFNSISGTCYPKYAGKTCANLGMPAQILTGVHADGNIDCSPLYHGTCNAATQVMTSIDATGGAGCSPRVQPPICPVNCVGNWGPCSVACGNGTQTYTITTPAGVGGLACPQVNGATQACNNACPVNCVGSWSACTVPCGGGTKDYTVTIPAANGGAACPALNGQQVTCNTGACGLPVDCDGTWSPCDTVTGLETFTITQAPLSGGVDCPVSPRTCAVDCVGSWSACAAGSRTFTWAIPPLNGGVACSYANGQTDSASCVVSKCGSSHGKVFSSVPASNLCNVGNPIGGVFNINGGPGAGQASTHYQWQCDSGVDTVWCYADGQPCSTLGTKSWSNSGVGCDGAFSSLSTTQGAHEIIFTDDSDPLSGTPSDPPTGGAASYTCNMDGSLSGSPSSSTCKYLSKAPCGLGIPNLSWGAGCVGGFPSPNQVVVHGTSIFYYDLSPPFMGTMELKCNNGNYELAGSNCSP